MCRAVINDGLVASDGCRTPELRHCEMDGTETKPGELRSITIKVPPEDDRCYRSGYKPRRQETRAGATGDEHDGQQQDGSGLSSGGAEVQNG